MKRPPRAGRKDNRREPRSMTHYGMTLSLNLLVRIHLMTRWRLDPVDHHLEILRPRDLKMSLRSIDLLADGAQVWEVETQEDMETAICIPQD